MQYDSLQTAKTLEMMSLLRMWLFAVSVSSLREYKYGHPPTVLVEKPDDRHYMDLENDIITGDMLPPPNDGITHKLPTTQIFVGISSLRDDRCGRTVHSLMTSAEHPERVFFGIVQQNDENSIDCIEGYCALMQNKPIDSKPDMSDPALCPHLSNIQTIRMKHSEAKGPNLARGLQMTMIDGQDFCLQIDAHTFGAHHWDTRTLEEWGSANNEMAVLTTYIGSPENLDKNVGDRHEVPHLCTAHLKVDFPHNERASAARYLENPILCGLWAAGFSFSKCHAELRVPYDVNLIQIWTGEEFGRGARLWTWGYDFYTPTQPLIAHDYSPGPNQKKWNHNNQEFTKSKERLQAILRQHGKTKEDVIAMGIEDKYDIGTKRTLEQYAQFSGIDIVNKKELFSWCQDYKWIPYEMTESEVEGIRKFGDPNAYRQDVVEEDELGRGFINLNLEKRYEYEEAIYREIVEEMHQFEESSWSMKLIYVLVMLIFLSFVGWAAVTSFRKYSPKMLGDKMS